MGKSAFGQQLAINAARHGVSVLVFSLEMSARELGRRALAVSGVPVNAMKSGHIDCGQAQRIVLAQRALGDLPLMIVDAPGLTAAAIASRARSVSRKGLGLIVIDHLHIIPPEDADIRSGPTFAVGQISRAIKRLAKDLRVPVVLLAQLNRGVEGREDKRPVLGDLRQTGDIEQDADAVGFVSPRILSPIRTLRCLTCLRR
jgi:replicative DNA helicase